jgi:hypothetical protein
VNKVTYFGFHKNKKCTENEILMSTMYNKFGPLLFGIKNNPQNFKGKNYNHFMLTVTVLQYLI